MSGYVLAGAAEQDLDSLWSYVAEESVDAADRLVAGIFESFEALARNPGMGHKREDLTLFPVRFWPVGNYIIIYRAGGPKVQIVAVVHGKRDIPEFLRHRSVE